jgi:hypothetical protein
MYHRMSHHDLLTTEVNTYPMTYVVEPSTPITSLAVMFKFAP